MTDECDALALDPGGREETTLLGLAREVRTARPRTGLAGAVRRRLLEIDACRAVLLPWQAIAVALARLENMTVPRATRLTAAYAQLPEVRARRLSAPNKPSRSPAASPSRGGPASASAVDPPRSAVSPPPLSSCAPGLRSPALPAPSQRAALETALREEKYRRALVILSGVDAPKPAADGVQTTR